MRTVYFDGGSRGNPGPSASAFVIYDGNSKVSEATYIGKATNNQAEYRGMLNAIHYLLQNGQTLDEVLILGDSLLVINQMTGKWKCKDPKLSKLRCEALAHIQFFKSCKFEHIRREKNTEADKLVNKCLDAHQ